MTSIPYFCKTTSSAQGVALTAHARQPGGCEYAIDAGLGAQQVALGVEVYGRARSEARLVREPHRGLNHGAETVAAAAVIL